MSKFRTHYDNLKVSRDAPIEVIQAAYRSLARKYHPDTNGNHPKSEAIMKAINASYEVLSDPVRRAKHDEWIAAQSMKRGAFHRPSTSAGHENTDTRSPGQRGGTASEWSFVDILLVIAYFGSAIMLLRVPNLRLVAIGMLVAGWIFFRVKSR
jgi:curved DNA-binding protein CbpA